MKTVMITGCSSGFGLDTARYFLDQGWSVTATMRVPDAGLLPVSDRLRLVRLDVTDPDSIRQAVAEAGEVDALVNNAGIGWLGPFENMSEPALRRIFETNTFGTFAMIRALLPQFRAAGKGVIVNVTSSVTMLPLPLLSVYTASKAAVNSFTECLAMELQPLGIRVALVLPGQAPATRFGANAMDLMASAGEAPGEYQALTAKVMGEVMAKAASEPTRPGDVAQAVWRAVTDPDCPLRLPAGRDAEALAA